MRIHEGEQLIEYLRRRARLIGPGCKAHAYFTSDYVVFDICLPENFRSKGALYADVPLPYSGTEDALRKEIDQQIKGKFANRTGQRKMLPSAAARLPFSKQ